MAVRAYMPGCTVTLPHKRIDLTPYLGEGGAVSTAKSLYAPKGRFQIVIPDKPYRIQGRVDDSFYGIVEPMDRVEIRMARNASEHPDGMPIVMRGFVREVSRSETMGSDGRPQRQVTISGDDYGMFGEIAQLNVLGMKPLGLSPLSALWPADLGASGGVGPALEQVRILLESLINAQINRMRDPHGGEVGPRDRGIQDIKLAGSVTEGFFWAHLLLQQEGTAWKKLMDVADTPWNEIFIEDRDDGPYLVYRPTPWVDLDGKPIDNMGQQIAVTEIEDTFDFVQRATYSRSDEAVYNVIWSAVHNPQENNNAALAAAIAGSDMQDYLVGEYGQDGSYKHESLNSAPSIYGVRIVVRDTMHYPGGEHPPAGNQAAVQVVVTDNGAEWAKLRRKWLIAANRDNVMWDSGDLTVRGNEKLRIGVHYILTRGQFRARHYVTEIGHHFAPYSGFTSSVKFIRSDNFYQRTKGKLSSFLLEGRKGVYA